MGFCYVEVCPTELQKDHRFCNGTRMCMKSCFSDRCQCHHDGVSCPVAVSVIGHLLMTEIPTRRRQMW